MPIRLTFVRQLAVIAFVALCGSAGLATAEQTGAIASAHPLATAAGRAVLEKGGNAFDAAVGVAAALAVVEPYSSGLGGGGFFLLHRAADGMQTMVDAREMAPGAVAPSQYVDAEGRPRRDATTRGGTAAAIPGTPAALVYLSSRYGRLPLAASLAPAIRLALDGFPVDTRYAQIAKLREKFLQSGVNTDVFLDRGRAPEVGFVLKQPDLGATLERIARLGTAGFYQGPVARAMLDAVNRAGGVWRQSDLDHYIVHERDPVRFTYRGAKITAAALPSAGGIALAQSLGVLERFPAGAVGEPATDHLVVEALRRAFQDRERYLGDPGFVRVPTAELISRDYAQRRASTIDPAHATRSEALGADLPAPRAESANTTHFSIVDADGNRVGATVTINLLFGAGIVAPGTGVLLNNEMDDFTVRDAPNAFLLRGGDANRMEPRKRPLSSMTPVFVEDDKGVLVAGAPGGSRIVSQVLLATLAYLGSREVDLARIVAMPRYHHQGWPDRIEVEPQGFSAEWRAAMAAKGHELATSSRRWGNMQAVFRARVSGATQAASDPRGEGVAWY